MSEYKIVVIEPDDDFRETLELLLNYSFEFEVIGLFKKCSAIKPGRSLNPGIVLAGITEISELAKIQKLFSQTPVVAITTDETDKNIVKLLASGAAHYIFKGSEPAVYLST
ncbi:MAG: response regulator transcription factor, partial [Chitinophagaceae bacterium]|nr:response regulator transcription factor [Chitinophagaceae bacterium]